MQYLTRYMTMLKVCELIGKMPSGGGWVVARDFVQWSGISRPTIYRYLKSLTKQGVLIAREHKVGKRTYREYRMSENGANLYQSQKKLFNWE